MSFAGDAIRIPTRRQISQAGFDQVVLENMTEFGMGRAEASADAVKPLVANNLVAHKRFSV